MICALNALPATEIETIAEKVNFDTCYSTKKQGSPYSTSSSMTTKRVRSMLNLPNRSAEHEIGGYDP